MSEILLRIVEGAHIALYRSRKDLKAELIPTRNDLYSYTGGYAWGYGGAGPNNLSHAIAGKIFEYRNLSKTELCDRARVLLDEVISKLDVEHEHALSVASLKIFFEPA